MYGPILSGIGLGMAWYILGERFDKKKTDPKCWELLHYYNKERFPLFLVHIKSIVAGLILILVASTSFSRKNDVVAFIGAAIIGLHILQWRDETHFIATKQ